MPRSARQKRKNASVHTKCSPVQDVPAVACKAPLTSRAPLSARSPGLLLWALAALPLLPPLTAYAWVWPSPLDAFLVAYAWSFAFCGPAGALKASFKHPDAPLAWVSGSFVGALAATPVACLLLWVAALASLVGDLHPVGGTLVDISCGTQSCQAGLFDHEVNRYTSFRLRPGSAPLTTGSTRHACLHPAWPQPVRGTWANLYAGCVLPEQFESDYRTP